MGIGPARYGQLVSARAPPDIPAAPTPEREWEQRGRGEGSKEGEGERRGRGRRRGSGRGGTERKRGRERVAVCFFLPQLLNPPPPNRKKLSILIHFHGSGFCTGSAFIRVAHNHLTALSAQAGILTVSVEYHLVPEHPIPTGYLDSWPAIQWVTHQATASPGSKPWLAEHGEGERKQRGRGRKERERKQRGRREGRGEAGVEKEKERERGRVRPGRPRPGKSWPEPGPYQAGPAQPGPTPRPGQVGGGSWSMALRREIVGTQEG